MANKNNKSNTNKPHKTMKDYEKAERRRNNGARVLAVIMIFLMLAFTVLTAGLFLMD